ncbi:hypothetical protein, partial [Pseudomonas syringae group genomosp. 7]|uniref:hypothetical protein n=1 Tax=Pseudomonas syringae group genomosp. 7 TaxID=251699 RepID=UPI00376F8FE3
MWLFLFWFGRGGGCVCVGGFVFVVVGGLCVGVGFWVLGGVAHGVIVGLGVVVWGGVWVWVISVG